MPKSRLLILGLIPVLAVIGAGMLLLSAGASAPLFGLYLSIAAWLLVLAFAVLPYLIYRGWLARRD